MKKIDTYLESVAFESLPDLVRDLDARLDRLERAALALADNAGSPHFAGEQALKHLLEQED